MRPLLLVAALLVSPTALAAESNRAARDTAHPDPKGTWSIGVFNPLSYQLNDKIRLETHPIITLTGSPHVTARVAHLDTGKLRISGEYGLSIPTMGYRFLGSGATPASFFPLWENSDQRVGWFLVPTAGVVVSGGEQKSDVWTARADVAFGLSLGANHANQLDSFLAPLNLLSAPLTNKFRARLGGAYDKAINSRFRVRGELNVYGFGSPGELFGDAEIAPLRDLSNVVVTGHVGTDIAAFERGRFTVGVYLANFDTHKIVETKGDDGFRTVETVRSWNVLPTIDYIWTWGGQ